MSELKPFVEWHPDYPFVFIALNPFAKCEGLDPEILERRISIFEKKYSG